jgi:alpha-tubulin suppressor-like RCC1 family protein
LVRKAWTVALAAAAMTFGLATTGTADAVVLKPSVGWLSVHSGPTTGGTTVTVHGHHFKHVRSVLFGTTRGSHVNVVSSTTLKVRAPRHLPAGVNVRVVARAGTSSINSHDRYEFRTYSRIGTGDYFSCRVASGGHVRCWGYNAEGELGDGTQDPRHGTVTVSGLAGVVALGVGGYHSCALKSDGTVWCWGSNSDGQVGDGTKGNVRPTPVRVHGLSHVVALGSGYYQSCAVVADGTARCWGDDTYGALGDGHESDSALPHVVAHLGHVVAIDANYYFGCARLADGTVWCWGSNDYGQLGNHSTDPKSLVPVQVHGLHGATAMDVGYYHACAVTGGLVHCWGRGDDGELGDGRKTRSSVPTTVSGLSGVSAIATGGDVGCAVVHGAVFCWGERQYSQIGDGAPASSTPQLTPAAIVGLRGITDASFGGYHGLVRLSDGTLRSWGFNTYWQLGNGKNVDSTVPVKTAG